MADTGLRKLAKLQRSEARLRERFVAAKRSATKIRLRAALDGLEIALAFERSLGPPEGDGAGSDVGHARKL